jgi:hypothetical protein
MPTEAWVGERTTTSPASGVMVSGLLTMCRYERIVAVVIVDETPERGNRGVRRTTTG